MATTTPNFGWVVPTSTDLVKDGATAIETLGDSIDASLLDLKGGTTGQVLSKNSNTDMDFTWVAQDDSNAIQNAIVDAKGDLIAASAADTPARLAVGTNGQLLTADSTAATGLAWTTVSSGGMTLITTTTWNNTVGTYTYSSLGSYKHLLFVGQNLKHSNAAAQSRWNIRFNGSTASVYGQSIMQMNGSTYSGTDTANQADQMILSNPAGSMMGASGGGVHFDGECQIFIPNYGSSDKKGVYWTGGSCQDGTRCMSNGTGHFSDTTAISSVTLFMTTGNFMSGTMRLYGVS